MIKLSNKKAVFLDRDGVLNVSEIRGGKPYAPRSLENFKIVNNAREYLLELKRREWVLVVVTNQPDVGNGIMNKETVESMHELLMSKLPIDHIEVCYHSQNKGCQCRKPKPGMLLISAQKLHINLENSIMIGDRASDIYAGHSAGCRSVFIDYQYKEPKPANPYKIVKSFSEAVSWILNN